MDLVLSSRQVIFPQGLLWPHLKCKGLKSPSMLCFQNAPDWMNRPSGSQHMMSFLICPFHLFTVMGNQPHGNKTRGYKTSQTKQDIKLCVIATDRMTRTQQQKADRLFSLGWMMKLTCASCYGKQRTNRSGPPSEEPVWGTNNSQVWAPHRTRRKLRVTAAQSHSECQWEGTAGVDLTLKITELMTWGGSAPQDSQKLHPFVFFEDIKMKPLCSY